jgi:prolyl oligopeptidase
VLLRSDWSIDGDATYSAGSLVSMNLLESIRAQAPVDLTTVLDPSSNNQLDAINGVSITNNSVYVSALKDVAGILLRACLDEQGWTSTPIDLPGNGAIQVISADDYTDTLLVNYESFLVPDTLYLIEGDAEPRQIKALSPRFDASDYVTEQHFANSADGTAIPYFVVRPAGIEMNGSTPTELTAYGGFEISRTPAYISAIDQAWISRGGAYVLANIRGGGEYGPSWHQSALLENRQRVFDDFIAVAEDVIDTGLTSSTHLGMRGGSNGGLLVTAVMVQRPELYKAIISAVPLIDMLRYHKLLAGASWMAEYGNPDIPEHHGFISEYSPYQLVSPDVDYPEIFLWTNPKDDRVHPGHARKMAARMLGQGHDIIYFENSEGGHGGGANLNQLATTNAMQIVYFLQQLTDG